MGSSRWQVHGALLPIRSHEARSCRSPSCCPSNWSVF